jgi:hypothetical protein
MPSLICLPCLVFVWTAPRNDDMGRAFLRPGRAISRRAEKEPSRPSRSTSPALKASAVDAHEPAMKAFPNAACHHNDMCIRNFRSKAPSGVTPEPVWRRRLVPPRPACGERAGVRGARSVNVPSNPFSRKFSPFPLKPPLTLTLSPQAGRGDRNGLVFGEIHRRPRSMQLRALGVTERRRFRSRGR